jgi:tetrahydromethanopterin S-methyltransferase subunit G
MEEILKQLLEGQKQVAEKLNSIDERLAKVEKSVAVMENDHGTKITALFDGYTQHNDQVERLQDHIDERLDAIQTDLSYVVGKVAQHDRNIVRLNKIAK